MPTKMLTHKDKLVAYLQLAMKQGIEASFEGRALKDQIVDILPLVPIQEVVGLVYSYRSTFFNCTSARRAAHVVVRELAKPEYNFCVSTMLCTFIRTPTEIADFLGLYWEHGRCPISAQVKKGLQQAAMKFTDAQYLGAKKSEFGSLKAALRILHVKPRDDAQASAWSVMEA